MHPLTEGNLAAAAGDAERLKVALRRRNLKQAVEILNELVTKLGSAVDIEAMYQKKGKAG